MAHFLLGIALVIFSGLSLFQGNLTSFMTFMHIVSLICGVGLITLTIIPIVNAYFIKKN